ncbi:MAG: PAS domain S-box protein [Actinomycetia bacterium]|nr:PAS domain S-box protein [Actinomycetes bacterium]
MDNSKKTKKELLNEIEKLKKSVNEFKKKRAITREDQLKLAVIDKAPFTLWACNRKFEIVLWTGSCESIYQYRKEDVIGKNYLTLFVDGPEKYQSEVDCIKMIDEDYVQKNFLAWDISKDGNRRTMLTNCFRIWDEDNQEYLQAEIALEISDLVLSDREHRTLRELGISRQAQIKKIFGLMKSNVLHILQVIYTKKIIDIDRKSQEIYKYKFKIEKEGFEEDQVNKLTKERIDSINKEKVYVENRNRELTKKILNEKEQKNILIIGKEINNFGKEDFKYI